jgi:mannose/fructose/N-acetylgalactosamine-specific phosphotransferase system component IIC
MYKKFIEKFRWYSPIIIGLFMGFNIVVGLAIAIILYLIPKWKKLDAFLFLFFYFFLYALSKLLHNDWLSPNFDRGNVHSISFIGIFLWFFGVVMVKLFLYFRQKKKVQ